jgi:chromate transport protein ChrA
VKPFLIALAILVFAILIVMATVFRHERSVRLLRSFRNALWVWVAVVVTVAAYRLWRQGGLW